MRALNPEIYWGEKPMDFSILNILVRTRALPPSDPWFAGAPLRYYFFGHEMIAFLSLVTGISTRYTFNLAFGWIGGDDLRGGLQPSAQLDRDAPRRASPASLSPPCSAISRACANG